MALTDEQGRAVVRTGIAAMASFDALLLALRDQCDASDFAALKQAVGKVMGEISVELLQPIFLGHPDLEPKTPEQWRLAGDLPKKDA